MPFEKGHKKLGGVKKGGKQPKTKQWEALADTLTGDQSDKFSGLMDALWNGTKADQLLAADLYIKMVEYFKPKQARVEQIHSGDVSVSSLRFEDAEDNKD